MKSLLATFAIALALGGTAAQGGSLTPAPSEPDLVPPPPAPAPTARNWTGAYGGLQLGAARARLGLSDGTDDDRVSMSGWLGGIYGGYNWHGAGSSVFGIEADLVSNRASGETDTAFGDAQARLRSSAALRARAGMAMGDTLLYGAAGLAHARYSADVGGTEDSGSRNGWTLGVGLEQAIAPHTTLRAELRHSDYGSFEINGTDARLRSNELRVGVGFDF